MRETQNDARGIVHQYDSYGEYLDAVQSREVSKGWGARESEKKGDSREWDLGVDLNGAFKLARTGWKAGVDKIASLSTDICRVISKRIKQTDWVLQEEGMFFDVARVVNGEPECWFDQEESRREIDSPRRYGVVTIRSASGLSQGVQASAVEKRGAIIAALVACLEYAGRPVALHVDRFNIDSGVIAGISVLVKPAGARLDMARVAFALMHPAWNRRLGFRYVETMGGAVDYHKYGYGVAQVSPLRADITLPPLKYNSNGQSEFLPDPESWIIERLKEQGIEVRR